MAGCQLTTHLLATVTLSLCRLLQSVSDCNHLMYFVIHTFKFILIQLCIVHYLNKQVHIILCVNEELLMVTTIKFKLYCNSDQTRKA